MTFFANLLVLLATVATVGLGWAVAPQNLPRGPDRGMYGLVCLMFQVPQALLLTIALCLCVARSAPWPAAGGFQYLLVLAGQPILCFAAFLCVVAYLDGSRSDDWAWASTLVIVLPFALAIVEIAFVLCVMNGATRGRGGWMGLAAIATASVVALVGVYLHTLRIEARTNAALRDDSDSVRRNSEAERAETLDRAFATLTPDAPLIDWLLFTSSDMPESRRQFALDAIALRPELARDVERLLSVDDVNAESQALTLIDRLPPAAVPTLLPTFQAYGRRLQQEIAAALADPDRDARRSRLSFADARVTSYMAAARGLHRAGVDVRPELSSIVAAVGTPDEDASRSIVKQCAYHLNEFSTQAGAK